MELPQAESGGMVASDRFDYQKDWTLCKLLELHESGKDYIVVCEFHEDVSVLDHAVNPTSVTFYQIKSDASKKWTITRLTNRRKGKDATLLPSILARLCGKKLEADACTILYRFTSNIGYSMKAATGGSLETKDSFTLAEIHKDDLDELIAALTTELQDAPSDTLKSSIKFEVGLPLASHASITKGKVADFIEQYAPGCFVQVSALYRAIFGEIQKRTHASRPTTALEAMCKAKGISRIDFDRMLKAAIKAVPEDRTWALIHQDLINSSLALVRRVQLDQAFKDYYLRMLNPLDLTLNELRKRIVTALQNFTSVSPTIGLMDLAEAVHSELESSNEFTNAALKKDELLVMVMVEIYEGQDPEVPSTFTQPAQA